MQEIKYDFNFYKSKDESPRHYRYKWKVFRILVLCGCYPAGLERAYPCRMEQDAAGYTREYRVDVFGTIAATIHGDGEYVQRAINIEVDGTIGHKERYGCNLDKLKIISIKECHGQHIETYRFTFKQLAKWTDEEIAEEMRLFYFD